MASAELRKEIATLQERVKVLERWHDRMAIAAWYANGGMRCENCRRRLRDPEDVDNPKHGTPYVSTEEGYFCLTCWDELDMLSDADTYEEDDDD